MAQSYMAVVIGYSTGVIAYIMWLLCSSSVIGYVVKDTVSSLDFVVLITWLLYSPVVIIVFVVGSRIVL